jgi:DnaJ-class molecular chaperone
MGLFNEWRRARNEKHITRMREDNRCPLCNGKGFVLYRGFDYAMDSFDCAGCNGTGLFSEWEDVAE